MAGAGFKTFNTGDVLTASDVNTYLMQQTVMVFADASARSTALGANVAEGMLSYLKDTNAVERYDGSSWGAIGAGDIEGVTAGTGLTGGGTSGTVTLSFDQANYGGGQWAAGKNKIINGDFGIWQRGTSVNLSASTTTFLADRFACYMDSNAGTVTYSQQTFTPGTAPVSGYENAYFARLSTGGNGNFSMFAQRIEDVRTFAGQTITVSFWMKSSTAKTFTILVRQDFGSGGSSVVDLSNTYTTTTSWARYSATFTLGSLSGKTIGTGSSLLIQPVAYGAQTGNFTIDIWGVQVEAGSTATPFQTATGTKQGELAACQRYYVRLKASGANYPFGMAQNYTTSTGGALVPFPVTMRTRPTALETTGSGGDYQVYTASGTARGLASAPTFAGVVTTEQMGAVNYTTTLTDLVAGHANQFVAQTSSGYLGWSAEL